MTKPFSTTTVDNDRGGFISLGCPKALVDSERILTQLKIEGYEITPHYEDAGVVIVNTCGFIDAAKEESLEAIGEAPQRRPKRVVGWSRQPQRQLDRAEPAERAPRPGPRRC